MSRWGIDGHRIAAAMALVRPRGDAEWGHDEGSAQPGPDAAEHEAHEHDDTGCERSGHDEPSVLDELFARAIWSVLVEPGDSVAGVLVRAVGAVTAARLIIDRVSPSVLCEATSGEVTLEAARKGIDRWTARLRAHDFLRSLESAGRCGAMMVVPGDPHWPEGFVELGDSPPVLLWARGDLELLRRPGVAIVGARAATGYGEHVAMELAAGLCARDVVIVPRLPVAVRRSLCLPEA
jgi:DNA processing protein